MSYKYISIPTSRVSEEWLINNNSNLNKTAETIEDTMTYPFIGIYEDKVSPENMPEIFMPSQLDARKILVYAKNSGVFTAFAETSWTNLPSLYETEEEFFNAVKEIKLESLL